VAVAVGVLALAGVAYLGVRRGHGAGKVIVTVKPAVSAELTVDGRSSGPLPPFLRLLPPGRHRIEVKGPRRASSACRTRCCAAGWLRSSPWPLASHR